ncbi:hypothetical protein NUU61_004764 [Penicillium alfredii]|uniref:Uncharacterized protein n=1 Tax=Penicillium alfredii TaxID=1506179 RepID=A0A9W9F889_9EURO|nr:uncharacterized protein NUU61_004764 [Penicillium alfredii]KAJ5095408.1 hypothetical protein NUU61_004764 [Penicillium alfredii]
MSSRKHASLASPQSSFDHAQPDSSYEFDIDTSHFPTPSKKNATRPRHNFPTSSLAGAYRAASRIPMSNDGPPPGSTLSPRRQRGVLSSPVSDTSNPPEELVDVYRRIEEDGTLADFVAQDGDWAAQRETRPASRMSRESSRARERNTAGSQDGHIFSDASFLDDNADHPPRRRTTDYARDEQRLRRVTGKDSPVFSRANVGNRPALTAGNLQRREEEEEEAQHVSEDDGNRGPSLNLPSTWGSRATRHQDWLRNVSRRSVSDPQEQKEAPGDDLAPKTKQENDSVPKFPHLSPRSLGRSGLPVRSALGERTANAHAQETQENGTKEKPGSEQNALGEGETIPNTPITIHKNSKFNKTSPRQRDSQDLLRRLSRTESPNLDSIKTPDQPKLFGGRIYDKTPRVTGAWIDTPMTERVSKIPSHLTQDIIPPPESAKETENATQQSNPPVEALKPKPEPEDAKLVQNAQKESSPESQPIKRARPPLIRPKLPKSALETVMEDVNSGKEELDMGDDTIESLQAILDEPALLKTDEEEEAEYEKAVLERLKIASSNGNDSVDIDRLNEKLYSLVKNINEVKKGLSSLEDHVARDAEAASRPSSPKKNTQPAHLHTGETCESCGTQSDGRVYAAIPLPRLWTRNSVSRRRQLTKLGWLTVVSLSWYVIECLMCEQYCHPLVSDTCDGYCLQPDAPHFPWVTTTMLWRWSHLSTLLTPVCTVAVAFFRLVAQLLGLWDGYVDEPPQLKNIVGEIRVNGTPVSFPWLSPPPAQRVVSSPQQQPVWTPRDAPPPRWDDEQASMDDDEYL